MSTDQILAFVLFAFVAAITPGPSNIILASTGATVGLRRGLPCLFGVALGMGAMIFLVGLGLGSLVLAQPIVLDVLRWGGIALLLWLAWKIATAGGDGAASSREILGFWQGAALQWVNPKSWVVSASAVGAYLSAGGSIVGHALWLSVLFVLIAIPSCLVWLAFGMTAQRFLRSERSAKRFNVAMGALLAASIILFVH